MPISDSVAHFAALIAERCSPLTPWEVDLCSKLSSMPVSVAERDLGGWESQFRHVWTLRCEGEAMELSRAAKLFHEVFEFGAHNLFGAFDTEGTVATFEAFVLSLNRSLAVSLEPEHDVSIW